MAIINSYPTVTPTGSDLIIGTDVSVEGNPTKTFTIDSINALATGTPAAGTLNTVALFTSAVALGDSTIVRSGAGATSLYTFGGGTSISNTAITTTDLTTTGNTILGNASGDTLTVNATSTFTGDVILPDNAKLEIGSAAGGDLQIYHTGIHSYIDEQGTGNLNIKGSTNVYISTASGGTMAQFTDSGSVFLNHSGSLRFSTSAAGTTTFGDVLTTGIFRINTLNTAPASAAATGVLGEIRFTATHIYVCVATNTWKRVAIATF